MHEFSLAQGLHGQIMELLSEHGMSRVIRVEVRIGADSGIVVESFVFGVNVLLEQYPETRDARLDIIEDSGSDLILQQLELE